MERSAELSPVVHLLAPARFVATFLAITAVRNQESKKPPAGAGGVRYSGGLRVASVGDDAGGLIVRDLGGRSLQVLFPDDRNRQAHQRVLENLTIYRARLGMAEAKAIEPLRKEARM